MVDQVVMVVEDNNGVLSTCPLTMINCLTQVGAQDAFLDQKRFTFKKMKEYTKNGLMNRPFD